MDAVRLEYLEAMGVTVWVRRTSGPTATRAGLEESRPEPAGAQLYVGPGDGSSLCICANAAVSGSVLASDIARALGEPVVWAWPADEDRGESLEHAIAERSIARVLLFGEDAAEWLFATSPPESMGDVQIIRLPDLGELGGSASQRETCWKSLCQAGIVKAS